MSSIGVQRFKNLRLKGQKILPPPSPEAISDKTKEIPPETDDIDKNLVQINVSNEEIQQRIQNFIERKREQVNISNIHDFIPGIAQSGMDDEETCARVRTQFVRRSDSKGHLKIRKVHNEWGPQTVRSMDFQVESKGTSNSGLPPAIAERVLNIEKFLNTMPVSKDIYKRLKEMEEKISQLEAMSPEYAQFWKSHKGADDVKQNNPMDYAFSAEDIARKIEQLEKEMKT